MSRYRDDELSRRTSIPGTYIAAGIVVILLGCSVLFACTAVDRVDPGNAGVLVDFGAGTVAGEPKLSSIQTSQYFFKNPIWQVLVEYPITQQTLTMNKAEKEGDDSIRCQDMNGVPVNIDTSTLWRVDPLKVGQLYLKRRDMPLVGKAGGDIESVIVRREVRNAVTLTCSKYRYDEMYGTKRVEFGEKATNFLGPELLENHILLDKFILGEIHLLPEQQTAINRKVLAEQAALEAAFLKQKAENEAAGKVADAEGQRKVRILQAQAEAEAIRIVNEQLGQSKFYIEYTYAIKWNGAYPSTIVLGSGQSIPVLAGLQLQQLATPTPAPTVPTGTK